MKEHDLLERERVGLLVLGRSSWRAKSQIGSNFEICVWKFSNFVFQILKIWKFAQMYVQKNRDKQLHRYDYLAHRGRIGFCRIWIFYRIRSVFYERCRFPMKSDTDPIKTIRSTGQIIWPEWIWKWRRYQIFTFIYTLQFLTDKQISNIYLYIYFGICIR